MPHWQVRLRLLVLLRPTWRSQTWSCSEVSTWHEVKGAITWDGRGTHVELLGGRAALATVLPLAGELVRGADVVVCGNLSWLLGGRADGLLRSSGLLGSDGLLLFCHGVCC